MVEIYNAFEKFYKSNNKTDFTLPKVWKLIPKWSGMILKYLKQYVTIVGERASSQTGQVV